MKATENSRFELESSGRNSVPFGRLPYEAPLLKCRNLATAIAGAGSNDLDGDGEAGPRPGSIESRKQRGRGR